MHTLSRIAVISLVLAFLPVVPAWAGSEKCGSCTKTISGPDASDYDIGFPERLCITSTGRLTGSLILGQDTSACNEGVIETARPIDVLSAKLTNFGRIRAPSIDVTSTPSIPAGPGSKLYNFGTIEVDRMDTFSESILVNQGECKTGHLTVYSDVSLLTNSGKIQTDVLEVFAKSSLENDGSLEVLRKLSVFASSTLKNRGSLSAAMIEVFASASVENSGELSAADIDLSSHGALNNQKSLSTPKIEIKTGAVLDNSGKMSVASDYRLEGGGARTYNTGSLRIGGKISIEPGSAFYTDQIVQVEGDWENGGSVEGPQLGCGGFLVKGRTVNLGCFGIVGHLDMCHLDKPRPFDQNAGSFGAGVTFCKCSIREMGKTLWGIETAALPNPKDAETILAKVQKVKAKIVTL